MTHTPSASLDDKTMWRKVLACLHPDAGGSHEAFIFGQAVRDVMCNPGGTTVEHHPPRREHRSEPPPKPEPQIIHEDGRVPFPESVQFEELAAKALGVAAEVGGIFAGPLRYLTDCHPMPHLVHDQERGASYKRLAYIAHLVGMSKSERVEWYRVAESIPLSDRHAGHILSRLKRHAA